MHERPLNLPFSKGDFRAGTARLPSLQRGIEGDLIAVVNLSFKKERLQSRHCQLPSLQRGTEGDLIAVVNLSKSLF
jgi:hypothetical protein